MKPTMKTLHQILVLPAFALLLAACSQPQAEITIDVAQHGADIPSSMYGIFFEEINHAGDGGLYAELVQNRGFEDTSVPEGYRVKDGKLYPPANSCNHLTCAKPHPDMCYRWPTEEIPAWSLTQLEGEGASMKLTTEYPLNSATPTALKVTLPAEGRVAIGNTGFWGMNIEEGKDYYLRLYTSNGKRFDGKAVIRLVGEDGQELCNCPLAIDMAKAWSEYTGHLTATGSDSRAHLVIELEGKGTLLLDYVSLFPFETFRNCANGLRKDIAETLEAMRPAFVRWPGGCVVEGITLSNRIKWKETIGDPVTRPGVYDTWGYRTTMGFGYHEFLQFCEDIGAGGMFVCNVGLGCQGRVGDACKEDEVDSFIEDVLDAIDYALGDGTTEWSRKRVENGHPAPFPLKYVEIGNENWGPVYEKRYDKFYKAIKEKYPQLKLISTLGLGGQHRHERVDMIDPHWYVSPEFFFASDKLFDQQERGDYEIYIGEYAVNQNVGGGNLLGALAEAAFLTGVERNSDLVKMASYAPLFENVNDRVWPTNLIWFDSYRVMGRSSYQVQKMYAENRPSFNVATSFEQPVIPVGVKGQIAVGGWNTDNEYKDLKVTLADGRTVEADMSQGWTPQEGTWNAEGGTLKGSGPGVMRWNLWSVPEAFGDCSISLKARKIAGAEGFLIYFGMHDGKNGYVLNIGGWGNQTTAFQRINGNDMPQIPNNISQYVEEGRWYDIRIDIKDGKFTYSLDGKQMLETAIENIQRYVVSGYDENTGELIVKFVNATKEPFSTSVNLQNVTSVKRKGKVVTLTSADPKDENTLDDPKRVFPRESTFNKFSGQFDYTFEPWSFTVLRIKAEI
ncbi:Alpha-N-arabinofuranosidase 1 precursor [Odoribacter splanchnicus]|jgi:glycoside hydrolase family protein|uniref:alpha-L-arabinofuranosidase C-terminal domain-containing protein n=1 Tax=Odoribacter splanchnicus TaxID=28118 RepID=UPI000AB08606|nr:alpha-L-arabinofuranosidase C-terminal domain-containing protein [Odoribacter splanchnicus]SPY22024.1 Alpha-N-arabinofuranosidase 1 precursor [Odoribacter splanchnicus]